MKEIVIDGKNAILGRLASYTAKLALRGNKVVVVNCNEILITGNPRKTIESYKEIRSKGGSILKGPFFPKVPERIVKRTIRGMLPYKQQRGRDALKRVMCHNEVPDNYKNASMIKAGREKLIKTISMQKLSGEL